MRWIVCVESYAQNRICRVESAVMKWRFTKQRNPAPPESCRAFAAVIAGGQCLRASLALAGTGPTTDRGCGGGDQRNDAFQRAWRRLPARPEAAPTDRFAGLNCGRAVPARTTSKWEGRPGPNDVKVGGPSRPERCQSGSAVPARSRPEAAPTDRFAGLNCGRAVPARTMSEWEGRPGPNDVKVGGPSRPDRGRRPLPQTDLQGRTQQSCILQQRLQEPSQSPSPMFMASQSPSPMFADIFSAITHIEPFAA